MEKDVKLREFCLELAITLVEPKTTDAEKLVKIARELEKYILEG